MTKTTLVLLVGGACAFASMLIGSSLSTRLSPSGLPSDSPAGIELLAWEQPPGVPPTGVRPKGIQQLAWEQPPGVPPTGVRPKGIQQLAWEQPPGVPPTGVRPKRIQQLAWEQPPGVPPTGVRPKGPARSATLAA